MKSLEEKIAQLEEKARELELGSKRRIELRKKVIKITDEFLNDLGNNPAYVGPDHYSLGSLNRNFLSESPADQVFEDIAREVDIPGINVASGKDLGYIPAGGLYVAALGDYWSDITNRYSGINFVNPGAVKIENELIRWMIELVEYPEEAWGNLASGGSVANLTAVICAREAHDITPDKIKKVAIYRTSQTHHCITKALKISGLHHAFIRCVPMDSSLRMDAKALRNIVAEDIQAGLRPFLVVSSAGTTDAGVIDPIDRIDEIAKEYNLWHHVDAAYGGYFLLTESCSQKLKAMNKADSLVMNPHKSLFLPYGLGIVLVKNRRYLTEAFSYKANYMQDAKEEPQEISPAEVSPELSKHFRGLRMWLPLKLHGLEAFKANLEEKHFLAIYFYEKVVKLRGIEVYQEPELSVVMFRYNVGGINPNQFNKQLVQEIHKDGRVFLSSTTINGNFWLRVAILAFRTHKDVIDLTLNILEEKIESLVKGHAGEG